MVSSNSWSFLGNREICHQLIATGSRDNTEDLGTLWQIICYTTYLFTAFWQHYTFIRLIEVWQTLAMHPVATLLARFGCHLAILIGNFDSLCKSLRYGIDRWNCPLEMRATHKMFQIMCNAIIRCAKDRFCIYARNIIRTCNLQNWWTDLFEGPNISDVFFIIYYTKIK